jgi:hypothetical protein
VLALSKRLDKGRFAAVYERAKDGVLQMTPSERQLFDNNGTERCLRGVVVGRKNHYASRSQRGTEVAALFYSLIESAKLAGVGPNTYLRAATMAALRGEPVLLSPRLAQPRVVCARAGAKTGDGEVLLLSHHKLGGIRWSAKRSRAASP